MRIEGTIWLEDVVEKLAVKHHVAPDEVEEVLDSSPKFYFVETGDREGEDVYMALGQTFAGCYLTILFVIKLTGEALVLSARDIADKERRRYGRK